MAANSEKNRSRTEQLREASRNLLMQFAEEDDWIDKLAPVTRRPEHGPADERGGGRETRT